MVDIQDLRAVMLFNLPRSRFDRYAIAMQMNESSPVTPLTRDGSLEGDIVAVGVPSGLFRAVGARLSAELEALSPADLQSSMSAMRDAPVVIGPDLDPDTAAGIYRALIDLQCSFPIVVFGWAADRNWANLDSCHYHSEGIPEVDVLAGVLAKALLKSREAERNRRYDALAGIHEVLERVAVQDDLSEAIEMAREGLSELIGAESVHYVEARCEPDDEDGTSPAATAESDVLRLLSSNRGALHLDRVDRDHRLVSLADVAGGDGSERLLGIAVASVTSRASGAFIALRNQGAPDFSAHELWAAEQFAAYVAGPFARHALAADLGSRAQALARPERASSIVYRRSALDYHAAAATRPGEPLRLSPAWVRWSYPAMLACLLIGLAYTVLAQVTEYAGGPAVVQLEGRKEIVTPVGGAIGSVVVSPGQSVEEGDPLLHFYRADEQAELHRLESEFEFQLTQRLLNPDDQASANRVAQLRVQLDRARSALEERTIRTPVSGVVPDLMVRPGQVFQPGDVVMTLRTPRAEPYIVALVPGAYRPRLRPGMALRLEIDGYSHAYQELTIDSVGEEVVSPAAARRYLGADIADTVSITGPVVPVRARLRSDEFVARGGAYRFHDGMHAMAEVAVGAQRLIFALLPRFDRVAGEFDGG